MIVIMNQNAGQEQVDSLISLLQDSGFGVHLSRGVERTVVGVIGERTRMEKLALDARAGVDRVLPVSEPYKLASRTFKPEDTVVQVRDLKIGRDNILVMAGPCAVESREQILASARAVKNAGAGVLRGGAFKPRTSPYSFQGLKQEGMELLEEASRETGLPVVTEVMDSSTLPLVARHADILQIGARNMQNFSLLSEVANAGKPVLLKRSPCAAIEEWLLAAEYILKEGNGQVILCERGIKTFEKFTRNTLDLTAVPVLKHLTHLPVVVDPSHAIGKWRYIRPMSRAAIAAGADGLLIEVHPEPDKALSDGPQSLTPENFQAVMQDVTRTALDMHKVVGSVS
ncbi:MAG: 3-deoxy-7-phosphoheptulonate synthase [Clostridiales bacterium]|nr:3-deoxy-7-phosphoheptulonate synthase [Clostridiales bacterium]MCF8023223.1 3-deoxy-7-phosphoheptulonate synthase [Clostridiales bacterium]